MSAVRRALISIFATASLLSAGGDVAPAAEEAVVETPSWSHELQIYALAPWMKGDYMLGYKTQGILLPSKEGVFPGDIDVGPDNIYKSLKMGFMAHYEAHHNGNWGIWIDYMFMDLGKKVDNGFNLANVQSIGVFEGIFEAFATYRTPLNKGYVDYFVGVRWWDVRFDMTGTKLNGETLSPKRTFDWYDPIIGAVWVTLINENWRLRLRGDIGGFGIASDFTAAIEIGALYDIDEQWRIDMKFKSLWVDYEEGTAGKQDSFSYDTVSFGPIVGITYRF